MPAAQIANINRKKIIVNCGGEQPAITRLSFPMFKATITALATYVNGSLLDNSRGE